jgi:hypothetical protein
MLLNDGTREAPKLRVYLNLDNLAGLRADSVFPSILLAEAGTRDARLAADGFEGVQLTTDDPPAAGSTLPFCGLDRVNRPAEAMPIVRKHADRGDRCLTLHVGWGLENDREMFSLVEAVLTASNHHRLPVFIETHRATITQDLWRTVQIANKFPEIRFNGDFSHYYCGQEMVYGGLEMKLAFMEPIFERVGFMHGRIASPGCIQAPIGQDLSAKPPLAHGAVDYLADFRKIWNCALRGFLRSAGLGDVLIFAPELLPGNHYYARLFSDGGGLVEDCDRYQQALLYQKLIREIFAACRISVQSQRRF